MKHCPKKCPICKDIISHGNINRHVKVCKAGKCRGKEKICLKCGSNFTRLEKLRYHLKNNVCGFRR